MERGSRPHRLFGRVLTEGRELSDCLVEIADGRIQSVQPHAHRGAADLVIQPDGWIAPGLIDLQVNGAGGVDLTSAEDPCEAVTEVALVLARHGVTAFCPTVVTAPRERVLNRLSAYRAGLQPGGATSLGTHVEGPFLDPDHRGVHDPRFLRAATSDEVAAWIAAGPPAIVTLASECEGALVAIEHLRRAGVTVSLGHSGADAVAAQQGLAAGARMGTHLFNGMPPLHHREPGLVGALLASAAILGLIADGVHVHPLVVDLVVRAAGVERVALVSDALAAAGSSPGMSRLGDQEVYSDGVSVRRTDGTLAGSALLLDGCLRNARAWLPWLEPAKVLQMATSTPAAALGGEVAAHKGRVEAGFDADLVVLDSKWNVLATLVGGEVVC